MQQIKPGVDGFPKYMYHPTLLPKIVNNAKEFQELLHEDKRWLDRYIHQDYPRAMYHKSGATKDVKNLAEKRAAKENGWRETPYAETGGNTPAQEATAVENQELKAQLAEMEELKAQLAEAKALLEQKTDPQE